MQASSRDSVEAAGDRIRAGLSAALLDAGAIACNGYPEDDIELVVAEGVRNLTRLFSSGAALAMECDPAYPYLIKMESLQRQYGLPGVDAMYHYATLHGDYRYRLFGNRGSAVVFEIEVSQGNVCELGKWKIFSTNKRSFSAHEQIDIRFDRQPVDGDWIELPEGDCFVMIRQYFNNWETESSAQLYLEREGAIYPPPPFSLTEAARRAQNLEKWMRGQAAGFRHAIEQHLQADPKKVPLAPISYGFAKLRYLRGHYRCARDQAVILEVKPPLAPYWNFQISNMQWEALDYHVRQHSINGHQAVVDSDGMFRAVISHEDPGVANWLDAGGRTFGLIAGRYFDSATAPEPTLRTVTLASLRQHLPPDTRTVSPAQRQVDLRNRMLSTIRRGCGD